MSQLEALMKLGLSKKEAQQTLQDDTRIDQGEDLFPLTREQEAVSKVMRHAGRTPGYNFQKKERKPNEAKRLLVEAIVVTLRGVPGSDDVDVTNPEREINFLFDGVRYRVTLSAPRKQERFLFCAK